MVLRSGNETFIKKAMMGGCCSKNVDIENYVGFYKKNPPSPTNECDKLYVNLVGEHATFACGHFWDPQAIFSVNPGVIRTRVGYTGGKQSIRNCPGPDKIGDHTEVVDIEFDPTKTNYSKLLEIFWSCHDPTEQRDKQFHSTIYYHTPVQKRLAEDGLMEHKKNGSRKSVAPLKHVRTHVSEVKHVFIAKIEDQHYYLQHDEFLTGIVNSSDPQDFMYSHLATKLNGFLAGKATVQDLEEQASDLHDTSLLTAYLKDKIEKAGAGRKKGRIKQ